MKRRLRERIDRERNEDAELVVAARRALANRSMAQQIGAEYRKVMYKAKKPNAKLLVIYGATIAKTVEHFASGTEDEPHHITATRSTEAMIQGEIRTVMSFVADRKSRVFIWNDDHPDVYICSSLGAFLERHPEFADYPIYNATIINGDVDTDQPTNFILYDENEHPRDAKTVEISEEAEQ